MNIFKNLFKKKTYSPEDSLPKPPNKIPMPPVKPPKDQLNDDNERSNLHMYNENRIKNLLELKQKYDDLNTKIKETKYILNCDIFSFSLYCDLACGEYKNIKDIPKEMYIEFVQQYIDKMEKNLLGLEEKINGMLK